MSKITIGVFLGSARKAAYSRQVANAICALLPDEFQVELIEIGNLPLFNQDYDDEGAVPDTWSAFRQTVAGLHGFLMVSPEYNRSVPPILKNAVDIASRPMGGNLWSRMPGAIISISPGKMGGYGASQHLRQSLTSLNAYVMQWPETYIGSVHEIFDEAGAVKNPDTAAFLQKIADSFAAWIKKNKK